MFQKQSLKTGMIYNRWPLNMYKRINVKIELNEFHSEKISVRNFNHEMGRNSESKFNSF